LAGGAVSTVSSRFWRIQSDFWNANPRAQEKAEKLYIADKPGQRIWAYLNDGSQWVQRPPAKKSKYTEVIRLDPQLARDMMRIVNDLAPMMTSAFDTHFGQLAIDAFFAWPKKTGLSKSMLELRYFTTDDAQRFHAVIVPRAPYSIYIKGRPFTRLLENNAIPTATKIADAIKLGFRRHE